MTDKACLADIRTEIFKTQDANGCFSQEQTVAKIRATTEMRTNQPFAAAWRAALMLCLVKLGCTSFNGIVKLMHRN